MSNASNISINGSLNVSDGIAEAWYNGDWFEGLTGPFTGIMGESAFALFVLFWAVTGTWVFTRSTSMTWVILAFGGAAMASALPGPGRSIGWMILFLTAGYALWKAYSRQT